MTDDDAPQIIRVIDVETTGLEPDSAVVEVGWTDVLRDGDGWIVGVTHSALVDPGVPIPPEASAIHHIVDADVKGALPLIETLSRHAVLDDCEIFAAHNAAHESQHIALPGGARWLCSYKCAVRFAPNARKWSNQYLRYAMKLDLDRDAATPPHRAGPDSYVTAHVIARMLAKNPLGFMLSVSEKPIIYPRLSFGKHKGVPCAEVPLDYWDWMLRQPQKSQGDPEGFDDDVIATARHYLTVAQERGMRQ